MNSTATRYKSDPDQNKEFSIAKFLGNVFWLALFGLLIIKLLFFQQVTVVGQSMEPNYFDGELLLVNNVNRDFQRGQVVAVYEDREVARDANYFY
jgi:signal peptidase I